MYTGLLKLFIYVPLFHILDQCKAAGLPAPSFEQAQGGLRIRFQARESVGVTEGVTEGVTGLYNLIVKEPGNRAPALAQKMQTSPKNVERWLKQLKKQGKIEFRGASKTGGYWPCAA